MIKIMGVDKRSEFSKVSTRLQEVFVHRDLAKLWQTFALTRHWEQIVGKNIAKKSEPAYIQKDTLWVYVQSSVVMQHMQPQKLSLLEKITNVLPDAGIKDIRWGMQPAIPAEQTKKTTKKEAVKPDREEQDAFEAMVSTVEDDQCRKALQKLWHTYHSR